MTSICIRQFQGKLFLAARNYQAGPSPDYRHLCRISEDEAAALAASGLISCTFIPKWHSPEAKARTGRYLSLEGSHDGIAFAVEMPEGEYRAAPVRVPLRGHKELLDRMVADTAVMDVALSRCGAVDRRIGKRPSGDGTPARCTKAS